MKPKELWALLRTKNTELPTWEDLDSSYQDDVGDACDILKDVMDVLTESED